MIRSISAFVSLFVFWLLLSGMFTPFLVTAGAGSAFCVVLFARRMEVVDPEGHPDRLAWLALFTYLPWLMKEIGVAAWDVTKRTLHPQLPISPQLVEFAPTQQTVMGLVLHANSITLTPGTISVEVEPGRFLVHALSQESADGLAGSEMDRRCSALETR